jgi:immune inhibitor A
MPNKIILMIAALLLATCCCCNIPLDQILQVLSTPTTTPPPTFEPLPNTPVSDETLNTLRNTLVPVADLRELACRLKQLCDIPESVPGPVSPLTVGTAHTFNVLNSVTNQNSQVKAVLQYVTPHAYFWVEEGIQYDQAALETLMNAFEDKIYPTDHEYFGSEWTPGVDGDEHLYILYTRDLGGGTAGMYVSLDEYIAPVHQYSNGHELFYVDSDYPLDSEFLYSTLAHEFQHMIHWYQDRNEDGWMNEGFADLADYLNGYMTNGWDGQFVLSPDLQLNYWPANDDPEFGLHYGASYLFTMYFLDRFGEEMTRALIHNPKNGLDSVDDTLADANRLDPLTGKLINADDLFLDWTVANYLQDATVADGRFGYHNYPGAPRVIETENLTTCPLAQTAREVHQYGADYIRITCQGNYNLHLEGYSLAQIVPAEVHSGKFAFWSNKSDVSDMTLTRQFDFTQVSGALNLNYWAWYDLEKDFDYVYLEASPDGQTWNILVTPSGQGTNPYGNSYGWGYTGASNGWKQERVDLSQFAGQKVWLRFEYVTDAMVNGNGFLLDDISIPEIGYTQDFENDTGGWEAAGFARIQNVLPQAFGLAVIRKYNDHTEVEKVMLTNQHAIDIPLSIGEDGLQEVVLVVSATTRYTLQTGRYQFQIR